MLKVIVSLLLLFVSITHQVDPAESGGEGTYQDWSVANTGKDSEGDVVAIKNLLTSKCADNFAGNWVNQNPIVQYPCNPKNDNQRWVRVPVKDYVLFKNAKSRKCMVQHSTKIGMVVVQKKCRDTLTQEWKVNGTLIINHHSGFCMEAVDGYPGKEIIIRTAKCINAA